MRSKGMKQKLEQSKILEKLKKELKNQNTFYKNVVIRNVEGSETDFYKISLEDGACITGSDFDEIEEKTGLKLNSIFFGENIVVLS
ncbi:MAG: hypothetical protein R3321_09015 [Nitrososphaeraceae archaeon]|nr:hypothetical protein [Nitrososphaeraceae archaeon]